MFCAENFSAYDNMVDMLSTHAAAAAAVATVYSEPAKDVTFPAPLVARVIASPPLEVTTVANDPPMARNNISQFILDYEMPLTSYGLEDTSDIASRPTQSRASLKSILHEHAPTTQ
jgi:hypothetical protein